jgi:hypothetical protein
MDKPQPITASFLFKPLASLVLWSSLASAAAANEPTVEWQGGRQEKAELLRFAPDQLVLRIHGLERTVAASEFNRWGRLREPPRGPAFLLSGGSLIVVDDWNVAQDRIRAEAFWATELSLERRFLRAAMLAWSTDAMAHDRELRTWLAAATPQAPPTVRDQLLLESGDTVSGGVLGWEESNGDEPRRLRVKLARGETRIAADTIRAIVWSSRPTGAGDVPSIREPSIREPSIGPGGPTQPPATASKPTGWLLGLRDGSLLRCDRVDSGQTRAGANGGGTGSGSLVLMLRDGVALTCDAAMLRDELVFVQPLSPRVRFLSDLETSGYRHVPLFGLPWGFERDANAAGGALRCGGKRHIKGLGMHATSRLAFSLGEPCRRFQARLGIDDAAGKRGGGDPAAGQRGSVIFRVYLDRGAGKWEPAFASGAVRGGDDPIPLDLDISGAQGLALIVDAADHGDQGDLANWLDARVE